MVIKGEFNENLKIFAQRLTMLRKEKGLSKKELADLLPCPASLITYYENAEREPGLSNIARLSQIFNETTDYIMGVSEYRTLKKIAE